MACALRHACFNDLSRHQRIPAGDGLRSRSRKKVIFRGRAKFLKLFVRWRDEAGGLHNARSLKPHFSTLSLLPPPTTLHCVLRNDLETSHSPRIARNTRVNTHCLTSAILRGKTTSKPLPQPASGQHSMRLSCPSPNYPVAVIE